MEARRCGAQRSRREHGFVDPTTVVGTVCGEGEQWASQLRQETGDHDPIGDVRAGDVGRDDEAVPVDAQVQLLPTGAGAGAVLPRRPLTLTEDLQPRRVGDQVDAVRSAGISPYRRGPSASGQK